MNKSTGFPLKGCKVKEIIKFLESQGYTCKNNGSSHMIFRKSGKNSISLVCHNNLNETLSPGVWRNIYKDFYGIDH